MPPGDPRIGTEIRGYRIEVLVGRGAMGVVYRATDLRLERRVALKLIIPELAEDPDFRARFLSESRLAASLDHPAVVPIYEAGEADGQLYIAMRYVDGSDLKTLLADDRPPAPERTLAILQQVAEALDAAHRAGLVHRDVKPGNVLLDEAGHAYLTDFGLSKRVDAASTRTGHLVGTLEYLAPEQIRGKVRDGRSDQYALACMLYECLAGRPPFDRESEAEVLWAQIHDSPPPIPDYPAVDVVLGKALAKVQEDRYSTCGELVAAARHALWLDATDGVATIMFTDVEGSTALADSRGDRKAKELIEAQRDIVHECVAKHGGRVIDSIGDGFMVAFDSTRRALASATDIQNHLQECARADPDRTVRLRIGLNVGEVLERDGHPFGAAVNAAARIAAVAKGGEVVVSDAVRQLAGTQPGVAFRDRGRLRLKGFSEPWRLYDVQWGAEPRRRPARRLPVRPRGRRVPRRRASVLAGAGCALVAAAALAAVVVTGNDDRSRPGEILDGDVVGAIDRGGSVVDRVRVPGSPARLTAAGTALWVGADDARTLTAVDRRRPALARVVALGVHPSDVTAGEGRLWVVDRGRGAVVAVEPRVGTVQRRIAVGGGAPFLNDRSVVDPWSIAVGAGRVWVTDGSRRLVEVDPTHGRLAHRIDARAPLGGVVVAQGAVWAISGPRASVVRIDPQTRSVTARISLVSRPAPESPYPIQIDAGAGALWVLNANTGTVSRIDPDLRGVTASIAVGLEHTPLRLSAGRDAVWVAARDGTLTRIDARTNEVRSTTVAHSLLDVAAVGDRVWVAAGTGPGANAGAGVATGTVGRVRPLPSSSCSPVYHAPGTAPEYLVVANLPLQGAFGFLGVEMSQATLFYLRERGFRAGRYALGLQVCDHSSPNGAVLPRGDRCSTAATAMARDPSVIGVVGPFTSSCAAVQLPLLNRARDGPLAMVSPTNTVVGLTRAGPSTGPGEPGRYQPTGRRGYARVIATDDVQAAADAMLARDLGLRQVYVLRDHDAYSRLVADIFARAAPLVGVRVAGRGLVDESRSELVRRVRRTRADGVFIGAVLSPSSGPLVRALRAALPPGVRIITPDGFLDPRLRTLVGGAADAMTVSVPGVPLTRLPSRGRRFVARFGRALGTTPNDYSVYTAQATQVLLDAIARSDGRRASVAKELLATRERDGILGRFSILPTGDTSQTTVTVYGYAGGTQRLFRVVSPPPTLLRRVRERPQHP
jgi:class 3 adenylate cyclase/ABC-type branched-subunit amino acid transport system substrate-binding protein